MDYPTLSPKDGDKGGAPKSLGCYGGDGVRYSRRFQESNPQCQSFAKIPSSDDG